MTKITRKGAERLREVQAWLREIRRDPDSSMNFDMDLWICRTSCCIGGKAAILAGYRDLGASYVDDGWQKYNKDRNEMTNKFDYPYHNYPFGEYELAIGLVEGDADALFMRDDWPEDLARKYADGNREDKIEAGIERIERFLQEVEVVK